MSNAYISADSQEICPARKSSTLMVLLMLVFAGATFSYLWAYAVPEALVAANVISRSAEGSDLRPRQLAITFASVMGAFLLLAMMARFLSRRQMRRIDAMADE